MMRLISSLLAPRLGLLILFWLAFLAATQPLQAQPKDTKQEGANLLSQIFDKVKGQLRYAKLDNGLRLILVNRGFAPVVACYIKFRAGSFDEREGSYGIAHMLEHMLFKGTRRVGTSDFAKEEKYLQLSIRFMDKLDTLRRRYEEKAQAAPGTEELQEMKEAIGKWERRLALLSRQSRLYVREEEDSRIYALQGAKGYNAYTSSDLTNYQVQLPTERLEVWARIESDRMQHSVLRGFYTERLVVAEERRMRVENSPRSQLWEKFRMAIYGSHPYGHPVIGPMRSIAYLNYHQAMDFYKRYYAPNNTVIAIVGKMDLDKSESLIRRYFAPLKARRLPQRKDTPKPKPRAFGITLEGGLSPVMYFAWLKAAAPHPDDMYMEALSKILAGKAESRLPQRLISKEKLAVRVFAANGVIGDRADNLFLIGVEPAPKVSLERIQAVLLEEIGKLMPSARPHFQISEEELALVRKRETLSLIHKLQSNAALADLLSYFESITGSYQHFFSYKELLYKNMHESDLQKAAWRYLQADKMMTARLIPSVPQQK